MNREEKKRHQNRMNVLDRCIGYRDYLTDEYILSQHRLPLSDMSHLSNVAAIYVVLFGNDVYYVGKTKNLAGRFKSHLQPSSKLCKYISEDFGLGNWDARNHLENNALVIPLIVRLIVPSEYEKHVQDLLQPKHGVFPVTQIGTKGQIVYEEDE